MSEGTDVTNCSQENNDLPDESSHRLEESSHTFSDTTRRATNQLAGDDLLGVIKNEIWLHLHKKEFMKKGTARKYLRKLDQLCVAQELQRLHVQKSITLLKKIISGNNELANKKVGNKKAITRSKLNDSNAQNWSDLSVCDETVASTNVKQPRKIPVAYKKLPCNFGFKSSRKTRSNSSVCMPINRIFFTPSDSGIEESDSNASKRRTCNKKFKNVFGGSTDKFLYETELDQVRQECDRIIPEEQVAIEKCSNIELTQTPHQCEGAHALKVTANTFKDVQSIENCISTLEQLIADVKIDIVTRIDDRIRNVKQLERVQKTSSEKSINPLYFDGTQDLEEEGTKEGESNETFDLDVMTMYEAEYHNLFGKEIEDDYI